MANWKKGYQPQMIIAKLEAGRIPSKDGKVSFSGVNYSEYAFLINSMLEIDKSIPEVEKSRLVSRSIANAGAKGRITKDKLFNSMNNFEKEYLARPLKRYRLITSMSVPLGISFPTFRSEGSVITVNPKLSEKLQSARGRCLTEAKHSLFFKLPSNYTPVSISIVAGSEHEAGETALERFDVIRAIWNLAVNRGQSWRMSWGRKKPVNAIVSGPIHTLHLPNGDLATDSWWYESEYQGPTDLWRNGGFLPEVIKFTVRFRKSLKKLPMRDVLSDALVRYVRALDSQNWQTSFLQLWGILELLTSTQRKRYDERIKRASFLFSEREYAKEVLNHLRDFRNRAVHAGADTDHIETLMYQSKSYVENLICFIVLNSFGFQSMEEVGDFLSTNPDRGRVKRKIKQLEYADRFLSNA